MIDMMPTDVEGNFESEFVKCGEYRIRVHAEGYAPAELTFRIEQDGFIIPIVQLRAIGEECLGTMTLARGYVLDALTSEPIVGATIDLRAGPAGASSEPVVASGMTDATGLYLIENVPAGYYTATIAAPGYEDSGPREVSACRGEPEDDAHLLPVAEPGLALVLNWKEPSDLDLHLLLPNGDEVAFGDCMGSLAQEPFAALQVDHKMADGPEAIRVAQLSTGIYTLYVHNFSAQNDGETGFQSSAAEVVVYEDSQPIRTYHVPTTASGYFWDVLELEGTMDDFQLRTLGKLRSDRANPLADGDYVDVCMPAR